MSEIVQEGIYEFYKFRLERDSKRRRFLRVHIYSPAGTPVGKTSWCKYQWSVYALARQIVHKDQKVAKA